MVKQNIWDITPLVTSDFPLWPKSDILRRKVNLNLDKGDIVTESTMSATVHLGAHADAPSHYSKDGATIDECDLEPFLGLCQVIRPKVKKREGITRNSFSQKIEALRVLFATATFDFTKPFSEDFASFDPSLFDYLAQHHVITVGIDVPSVDLFNASGLPCHQQAYKYNMRLLENLDLKGVPEGIYELIALPLKIQGFDASPIRAVLRTIN